MTRNVKTASAALKRTTKAVDGLQNVVAGLGTSQDKRAFNQYAVVEPISRQELENMYRCSWLSKRIVNAVADDMVREWLTFTFESKDEQAQFKLTEAEKQLGIRAKISEALKWARLYGGSVMIIGTTDNSEELKTPLDPESVNAGGLKWLHALDRWRVSAMSELTSDMASPNFGLPNFYQIAESSVTVHWSRVLRFNGQKLPFFSWQSNGRWDDSELQHVKDALMNNDQTTQSIATMLFESNVDVVKVNDLAALLSQPDGEKKLVERFRLANQLKSFNRMLLLSGDEEYEKKQNSFANLHEILNSFMVDVCGAADIPMTRLFGQSPGGLNSTGDGDIRNYYDRISAEQEEDLRPQLERLYNLLARSTFGSVPENFRFEFNPLWQISATEQAAIGLSNAQRDQIYLQGGVILQSTVASELREEGTYNNLTEEDVELLKKLEAEELSSSEEPGEEVDADGNLIVPTEEVEEGGVDGGTEA